MSQDNPPVIVTCTSCSNEVRATVSLLGKRVRCPLCKATFLAQAAEPTWQPSSGPPKEESRWLAIREERRRGHFDDPDDEPRRRPAREYEEYDEPRPRRRRPVSSDEDDRDRPRRRRSGGSSGLVIAGVIVFLVLVVGGGVTAIIVTATAGGSSNPFRFVPGANSPFGGAAWTNFTIPDGKASIMMPGHPKLQTQPLTLPGAGFTVLRLHILEAPENESIGLALGYCDYPSHLVRRANVEEMLDGARDGAVRNVNGTLISESRISVQGNSGREVHATTPDGNFRARFFMVANRMYMLMVIEAGGESIPEQDRTRFFDSFQVRGF